MLFIAFAIYIYTRAYNEIIFFLPVSVTESKTRKKNTRYAHQYCAHKMKSDPSEREKNWEETPGKF